MEGRIYGNLITRREGFSGFQAHHPTNRLSSFPTIIGARVNSVLAKSTPEVLPIRWFALKLLQQHSVFNQSRWDWKIPNYQKPRPTRVRF